VKESSRPRVLLIDDQSEEVEPIISLLQEAGVEALYAHPGEVRKTDLCSSSLVLLDLDLGRSSEPEIISGKAEDGLALAAVLRREPCVTRPNSAPIGFALLSGKLDQLANPFPPQNRTHLLAKHHNLEWVFLKTDGDRVRRIVSLANAISQIPKEWGDGIQSMDEIAPALGIVRAADFDACVEAIERCHPPIYEFTEWSHGLALIRWLLHTVLSYPCFLWDASRVAARLRIRPQSFEEILKSSSFAAVIDYARYVGVLRDFAGRRWWRHRIEKFVWDLTDGDSQNASLIRERLSSVSGAKVERAATDQPVVCLDEDYQPLSHACSVQTAVRVQPDDWPAFADAAWMPIELVNQRPHLRMLVTKEDQDRVPETAK
jgi:CheY-like chemotaxis protein